MQYHLQDYCWQQHYYFIRIAEHNAFNDYYTPKEYYRRKVLYSTNLVLKVAVVRILDDKRYKELQKRNKKVVSDYKKRNNTVAKAYKDSMPYMTSMGFWKKYLEM